MGKNSSVKVCIGLYRFVRACIALYRLVMERDEFHPAAGLMQDGWSHDRHALSRNDEVALGSAVVSTAVFGVAPKTSAPGENPLNGDFPSGVRLAGGTPTRATETVALPISTAWLRLR